MQKRTRYLLLFGGFFIFFVLAPLLIFYVGGLSYDIGTNKYLPTGILAVQTDPPGAQIFLDNKLIDTSPKNIRFLKEGEYQVSLKKDGYYPWQKRLPIWENKVTWTATEAQKVFLLLEHPLNIFVDKNVLDFEIQGPKIYYITNKSIVTADVGDADQKQVSVLPKPVNKILVSPGESGVLLEDGSSILLYNTTSENFTDLSVLLKDFSSLSFSPDGNLLGIFSNTLYKIDPTKKQKIVLATNVLSYNIFKQNIYFLKGSGSVSSLFTASALGQTVSDPQTILENIPIFKHSAILITGDKEVFIVGDGSLYRVADKLENIAQNLDNYWLNPIDNILSFSLAGELYYFGNGEKNLITRSSGKITNAILRPEIGYSFFTENDQISALELDSRYRQNRYQLANASSISKMSLDHNSKTLYYLKNGELKFLNIR